MKKFSVRVNNVPAYAYQHRYIAVHIVDGEMWFYGAYDDENIARKAAAEYNGGGIVVENDNA